MPKLRFEIEVEMSGEGEDFDCTVKTAYRTLEESTTWAQVILGMSAAGEALTNEASRLLLSPERRKEATRPPN